MMLAHSLSQPTVPVAPAWLSPSPRPSSSQPAPRFELRSRRWDDARFKRLHAFLEQQQRRTPWLAPGACGKARVMAVLTGLVLVVGRELVGAGASNPSPGKSLFTQPIRPALTRNSIGVAVDF
jgi:hypothetical protein